MLQEGKTYKAVNGLEIEIISKIPTSRYGFLFEGGIINDADFKGVVLLFDEEGNYFDCATEGDFSINGLNSN